MFVNVFWAILNCRSPEAGIIKLEWWVKAIFRKKPKERGEFKLIEPLKYHVVKNGGTIVQLFLCCSVDRISRLLRNFRWILTSEKSSEHKNLSVGVGGLTLKKYLWIEDGQNSMPPKWLNYPEFVSGPNKATTDAQNLFYLNGRRSTKCRWIKVCCKSTQTIYIKHYCDCWLYVSETFLKAEYSIFHCPITVW